MSEKTYPCFCPTIDRGRGRTRELLDELMRIKAQGCPEGAAEMLGLLNVAADEGLHPSINYQITEQGPIFSLMQEFAQFITDSQSPDSRQPVAATGVGSATGGLIAALMAHDVSGGEVITTSLNFFGVPNAIVMAGATPRFVDVGERDWCMSMSSLDEALSNKTRAIVLTHLNKAVDVEPIRDLLKHRGLDIPLMQDASVAMGSTCAGVRPGGVSVGDYGATVYSFAVSKVLSGLGGGVVVAHDADFLARVHAIAYQGISLHTPAQQDLPGANFKMNDLNAAIVRAQFARREELFEKRRRLRSWYEAGLDQLIRRGDVVLQECSDETVITHFALTVPDRHAVATPLWERYGIMMGTWPMGHLQPTYRERCGMREGQLPLSASLAGRFSFLPFYGDLLEGDVARICAALEEVLGAS